MREIEARISDPAIWSDQAEAQRLLKRKSELTAGSEALDRIKGLVEEAEIMIELAEEAHDNGAAEEAVCTEDEQPGSSRHRCRRDQS